MKKVMIDSGHFKGNSNRGQTGYYEHEGVWKISNYLKQILESNGVQVDFTKLYEEDLELYKRGQKAQDYDLFISEHTNGYNQKTQGVEVFYDYSKPQDKIYAEELSLVVSKVMNNPNRGAKTRIYNSNRITYNYYGVIRGASATNCPHIFLIESGYHDNLIDEAFLKIDENLKKIAQAQANVILKILGIEVKEMTFNEAKQTLKDKAGLDNNSIQYLEFYRFGEDLIKKLADAIIDDNVIIDEPIIETPKIDYKEYSNMTELKGNPELLDVAIVDKKIWDITDFTNCTNGTYYWFNPDGTTYATSILYVEGDTYQDVANHYYDFGCPQSVFIVYKDNTVNLKRIKFLSELDLNKIKLVIGGLGLKNTQDSNFVYSPVSEGFKAGYRKQDNEWVDYSDVLRKTNKTVLGYNKKLNKIYLLTIKNVSHGELLNIISDNSTGEAYDVAISLDSGGSSFMDANGKYVFEGENGRRIHNIIRFNLN
mgnify:CR=1 FL=1